MTHYISERITVNLEQCGGRPCIRGMCIRVIDVLELLAVESTIVMTKNRDFVDVVNRLGTPSQVIWLTCGNRSNARLKKILTSTLRNALLSTSSIPV